MCDKITETADYGDHITLYCVNHPDLRWYTKNIDIIGARTVFYSSKNKVECHCKYSQLRVLAEKE